MRAEYSRSIKYRGFIIFGGIILLITLCLFFGYTILHASEVLFQEKISDYVYLVDVVSDEIDNHIAQGTSWDLFDYKSILASLAARIDTAPGIYAALYDDSLTCISELTSTFEDAPAPFEPLKITSFMDTVAHNNTGYAWLKFQTTEDSKSLIDLYTYFRWVPTNASTNGRVLICIGVSSTAINNRLSDMVFIGAAVLVIASTLIIVSNVILLSRLGHINNLRRGPSRWRSQNFS